MYDNLDDASPPVPPPGARESVSARASRLRRRRLLIAGGSGTALVAAVALVLIAVSNVGSQPATLITATSSPTPTVDVTPVASPSSYCTTAASCPGFSPAPHPTCPPSGLGCFSPRPSTSATLQPTPTPTPNNCSPDGRGYDDCPDGQPGWSTGFTGCTPFEHGLVPSGPSFGVSRELRIPSSGRRGATVRGDVVFTNGNDGAVHFTVNVPSDTDLEVGLLNAEAQSAQHSTDVVQQMTFDLAPGESASLPVHVATTACGDTSRDAEPALPAGHYTAWARITLSQASAQPSSEPSASPQPVDSGGAWDLTAQVTLD